MTSQKIFYQKLKLGYHKPIPSIPITPFQHPNAGGPTGGLTKCKPFLPHGRRKRYGKENAEPGRQTQAEPYPAAGLGLQLQVCDEQLALLQLGVVRRPRGLPAPGTAAVRPLHLGPGRRRRHTASVEPLRDRMVHQSVLIRKHIFRMDSLLW